MLTTSGRLSGLLVTAPRVLVHSRPADTLYRALTGLWIDLWHDEGMRTVTAAVTGAFVLLVLLGVQLESAGLRGAGAVAGLVLGVAYILFWRWVERRLIALWSASS